MDIQKHTGIYATSGDVRAAVDSGVLHNPYIAIVQDGNYLDWNGGSSPTPPEPVYSAMPLTFEVLSAGTIVWKRVGGSSVDTKTIKYSKNEDEWITITSNTGASAPSITVSAGDKVQFVGDNAKYYNGSAVNSFSGTALCKIYGNIMSLINSTGFTGETSFQPVNRLAFYRLFYENKSIVDAENLILPVKQLEYYVYQEMFYGCKGLVKGPEILAETLASLSCENMFRDCSNLNYIKCLATDISATNCTRAWLQGVSSSGTFVKAAGTTWPTGFDGIPSGWTVIDAE